MGALYLGSLDDLLLAHGLSDCLGISFNPRNKCMREFALRCSFIESLDDNGLLSSETTRQDDNNFTRLHEFDHLHTSRTLNNAKMILIRALFAVSCKEC